MQTTQSIQTTLLHSNAEKPKESAASFVERKLLASWIEDGKKRRFSTEVRVTPGLAAAMLVHNLSNRPITESQVLKHMRRLKNGEFILHHHGIAFAKNGALNDGQHRLTAILRSGIPGIIQVTFGAEREEFHVIDQGKSRTSADLLAISGEKNTSLRASIAAMLLRITSKDINRPDPQSVTEYAMMLRSPLMDEAIATGEALRKICAPTVGAVAYWWIASHSKYADRLPQFLEGMATGEGLSGAKLGLREWLIAGVKGSNQPQAQAAQRVAIIINAWNMWLKRRVRFETTWKHTISLPAPM